MATLWYISRACTRFPLLVLVISFSLLTMFAFYRSAFTTHTHIVIKNPPTAFLNREHKTDSKKVYSGIPKIIHQIWKDDVIPEVFQENIKGLVADNKPPEWQYFFWTDETGEKFLNDTYPSLIRRFSTAREILKADILRLAVIHHYGGVYLDLDTVSVKPLNSYVENHNCSFTYDPPEHFLNYYYKSSNLGKIITNCVLLCKPGNWFIWHVMEQLSSQSENCTNAIKCTGPDLITEEYLKLQSMNISNHLPPLEDYQLFTDKLALSDVGNHVTRICRRLLTQAKSDWRKDVCQEFVKRGGVNRNISDRAYTYHTWFHINMNTKKIKQGVNKKVKELVPHAFFYTG